MKTKLQEFRTAKGWTQGELAELLEVSRQTINAIENNKFHASLPLALRCAKLFEVTVEDLFQLD